jgi:hypothetical protein
LPWAYRFPFYLLLLLLFAYPAWLGHLSLENRLTEMSSYVLGFPMIAAVLFALLAPAARRRGADVTNNGTPWGWPLYPWSLFVLVAVGVMFRAYAVSMSFDPTKTFATGFQAYFFIPLFLSWILLWVEGADHSKSGRQAVAVIAPLSLLLLALPGATNTLAQQRYLDLLQNAAGSPIQVTAALLIAYFVCIWIRGIHGAEAGLLICLSVLAVADSDTLDLETIAPLNAVPLVIAVGLLLFGSIARRSAIRLALATAIIVGALSYGLQGTAFVALDGYLPIHLMFFLLMSLGILFHDWLGRLIARAAAYVLPGAAILMLINYRFLFSDVPLPMHAAVALIAAALAAAYWLKIRRFADLVAAATCLVVSVAFIAEYFIGRGLAQLLLQGKRWIAWGVVCFIAGLLISLAKAGQLRRLRRALMRIHLACHGSK